MRGFGAGLRAPPGRCAAHSVAAGSLRCALGPSAAAAARAVAGLTVRAGRRGSFSRSCPATGSSARKPTWGSVHEEPRLGIIYFSKIDCAFSIASRVPIFFIVLREEQSPKRDRTAITVKQLMSTSVTQVSFSAPFKILLQS